MKLDLPSFLLGCGVGVGTVLLGKRLSPLLLESVTLLYRFTNAVVARTAMQQEELDNLLAEARARARGYSELRRGQVQAQ